MTKDKRSEDWENAIRSKALALPSETIQFVHLDSFQLNTVDNGVLYYHGDWSGPSIRGLRLLVSALSTLKQPPRLYVLNADDYRSPTTHQEKRLTDLFGEAIGAWGETAWITRGRVVERDVLGKANDVETLLSDRMRLF